MFVKPVRLPYNDNMPNDYMTLQALAAELSAMLYSGRVNKINMPSEDEIVFEIRAQGANRTLLLSARKPLARMHLTSTKNQALPVPPTFCMLLRKYLIGGVVVGVALYNNDRIAVCDIESRNELRDLARYRLIAELGGSPNVILAKEDMTIIDCLRRASGENGRSLLPNINYVPPPQNKPNLFEVSRDTLSEDVSLIAAKFVGASRETAAEIGLLAASSNIGKIVGELDNLYNSPRFAPCVSKNGDETTGYFAFPYRSLPDTQFVAMPTLNAALDAYYSGLAATQNKRRATAGIRQTLKKLKNKTAKKLADNDAKLSECAAKERILQLGELIKCNAHSIRAGQDKVQVYDFYNSQNIEIALDPALSPYKNAAVYYRKYSKLKGAEIYAIKEKSELIELDEYLANIEASLDTCTNDTEYAEIADEIAALVGGTPKTPNKSAKKRQPSQPIKLDVGGFVVYIGKNNIQNDIVTFKIASGRDVWLHAKGYHGSHAVIITGGKTLPQAVLAKVASFVAYMSQAQASAKVDIDYTRRANVKRLGKPGLVSYSDYKTITVSPAQPIF